MNLVKRNEGHREGKKKLDQQLPDLQDLGQRWDRGEGMNGPSF